MAAKKKPDKRRHNPSAYVNRGVDANRNEWWDEEDARCLAEAMKDSESSEDVDETDTPPIGSGFRP